MIQFASRHGPALNAARLAFLDSPRSFHFVTSFHQYDLALAPTDWTEVQRVSVGPDATLQGFLMAEVDRDARTIEGLLAVSFVPGSPIFGRDLVTFIGSFLLAGWVRIGWAVYVGNPAEAMYDRLVVRLGGRVVGTKRHAVRLRDGTYTGVKMYEVLAEEVPEATMALLRRLAVPRE